MLTLALDTSGGLPFIAVRAGLQIWEWCGRTAESHSEELAEAVSKLLDESRESTGEEVSRIVLGEGPGSFTGLRIGYSLAKGIAMGRKIPLIAYSSFEAYALEHCDILALGDEICVIGEAGRSEFFRASFQVTNESNAKTNSLIVSTPLSIVSLSHFLEECRVPPKIMVSTTNFSQERLRELKISPLTSHHVADSLLTLDETGRGTKREAKEAFSTVTVSDLSPLYLREVAAKTIEERKQHGAGHTRLP